MFATACGDIEFAQGLAMSNETSSCYLRTHYAAKRGLAYGHPSVLLRDGKANTSLISQVMEAMRTRAGASSSGSSSSSSSSSAGAAVQVWGPRAVTVAGAADNTSRKRGRNDE